MSEHAFSDVTASVDSTARTRAGVPAGREAPTVGVAPTATTAAGGR
ncbi:hypothetical protein [Haloarchaeobius amylolyticus]|nr:hypothetical protein [Haloarchaeobius amylolyticus]